MAPNLSPTPAEATLVNQIFLHADPQKLGVITSDAAVKVFDGSKLPATVLGEIWAMADEDNNGWLSRKGVAIVVRLMGWAQKGEAISPTLLQKRTSSNDSPLPVAQSLTFFSLRSISRSPAQNRGRQYRRAAEYRHVLGQSAFALLSSS
jgi:Cytoskeletal-regulatory complex EF hand